MSSNGLSASRDIDVEIDASGHHDVWLLEHSEFYDPTIRIVCSDGLSFTIEALSDGHTIGAAVPSAGGVCKIELGGTYPPTAQPAPGPSLGFRITNTDASRSAFRGAVAWTYGRTR